MSIQTLKTSLRRAYDMVVVPKIMLDTPIAMKKMQKEDEEGNLIEEYYSINELSTIFGNFFTPIDIIDDRFVAFRWSIPRDEEEETNLREYLQANGLVSMRAKGVAVVGIDFTTLVGNEYGIFSNEEFMDVPRVVVDDLL